MSTPTTPDAPSTGEPSFGGHPLARPWVRIAARLSDGVIFLVVSSLIYRALDVNAQPGSDPDELDTGALLLAITLSFLFSILWDPVLTKLRGGSPGKLVAGMRVLAADGGAPSWPQVFVRWGIPMAFTLIPLIGAIAALGVVIVSLVFLFTHALRQAVWDRAARTVVVTTRR